MINKIILIIKNLIPLMQELLRRKRNEEAVRKICKEEGLNQEQTMEICGTIYAESGFDNTVIHENQDGETLKRNHPAEYARFVKTTGRYNSSDFYICQYNNFWWYFKDNNHRISPEQAKDISTAVRLMIKTYRLGHLYEWYGYKSKAYYAYLKKGSL